MVLVLDGASDYFPQRGPGEAGEVSRAMKWWLLQLTPIQMLKMHMDIICGLSGYTS